MGFSVEDFRQCMLNGIDGAFLGGVSRVRTALDDGVPAVLDNDLPGQA